MGTDPVRKNTHRRKKDENRKVFIGRGRFHGEGGVGFDVWKLSTDQITALEALHNEFKALHAVCQTASYTKLEKGPESEIYSAVIP
jgi:hypothetical protein